jgi:hypothetical protein
MRKPNKRFLTVDGHLTVDQSDIGGASELIQFAASRV